MVFLCGCCCSSVVLGQVQSRAIATSNDAKSKEKTEDVLTPPVVKPPTLEDHHASFSVIFRGAEATEIFARIIAGACTTVPVKGLWRVTAIRKTEHVIVLLKFWAHKESRDVFEALVAAVRPCKYAEKRESISRIYSSDARYDADWAAALGSKGAVFEVECP